MTVPTLPLHTSATVELDSQKIKSVPIHAIRRSATLVIDLHGEFYDGGMIVTVEMQDMTPIQSELVRSGRKHLLHKIQRSKHYKHRKIEVRNRRDCGGGGAGGSEGVEK